MRILIILLLMLAPALFAVDQMGGDDAEGFGPLRLGGARDFAHQAKVAGAIDQPPAEPGVGEAGLPLNQPKSGHD